MDSHTISNEMPNMSFGAKRFARILPEIILSADRNQNYFEFKFYINILY